MKVLHFLDSVNRGGAETQVLDVCRNAARFGMELTLVTAGGGAMEDDFRASGVEFIRLKRRLPVDPGLVSELRRVIREHEIEVVHGYQAVDGMHLYLATRRLKNVRRVLSFQGFIPGKKNQIAAKMIAPKMHANISVSRNLMTYLRDEVGFRRFDNFHVIYNGADPERLRPSGNSVRTEFGIPGDAGLGAMIANFMPDPTKDQLTVCRALPAVFERLPNFQFIFVGRVSAGADAVVRECKRTCEAAGITANVHFLGARTDVADILSELDLFVFSSRREGFPVALSEAMLAGAPVVVSDIEPLRAAVRHGELGEIFPVGDSTVLGEKIVGLIRDPERRKALSTAARDYARENFSIDAHMKGLMELYRSVCSANGPFAA